MSELDMLLLTKWLAAVLSLTPASILALVVMLGGFAAGTISGWYEPKIPRSKILRGIVDYGAILWILQVVIVEVTAALWYVDTIELSGYTATAMATGTLGSFALFLFSCWAVMTARAIGRLACRLSDHHLCLA